MTTFTDNVSQTTKNPKNLDYYDFCVPEHLIAQQPLPSRNKSRLLVANADSVRTSHYVTDLANLLPESSLLIFNDTKVFPSRLIGNLATGGKAELFLLSLPKGLVQAEAKALGRPSRKLRIGTEVFFPGSLIATVTEKKESDPASIPSLSLKFNKDEFKLWEWINQYGYTPLPPYIKRNDSSSCVREQDKQRYQTVYANERGSVAAPTAGLHFDKEQMKILRARGIQIAFTTLHVGAGTFLPIKSEKIENHRMHDESYSIPRPTWEAIEQAKREKRKIVGVGTTSFRSIESFSQRLDGDHNWENQCDHWLKTDLFVHPKSLDDRYQSQVFDGLITNFHQPRSTLYLLISALMGIEKTKEIYDTAIENNFRFFSYGDSSLLWF